MCKSLKNVAKFTSSCKISFDTAENELSDIEVLKVFANNYLMKLSCLILMPIQAVAKRTFVGTGTTRCTCETLSSPIAGQEGKGTRCDSRLQYSLIDERESVCI